MQNENCKMGRDPASWILAAGVILRFSFSILRGFPLQRERRVSLFNSPKISERIPEFPWSRV
jgi:hypothetical protein